MQFLLRVACLQPQTPGTLLLQQQHRRCQIPQLNQFLIHNRRLFKAHCQLFTPGIVLTLLLPCCSPGHPDHLQRRVVPLDHLLLIVSQLSDALVLLLTVGGLTALTLEHRVVGLE